MKTFSERLRHARELRRLTQADLARACKLSQGAIANYESGLRHSPRDIFRLAAVLQVNAQWLYEGAGPMLPKPTHATKAALYLSDGSEPAAAPAWPFRDISPEVYWALSEKDQTLIENTVSALLDSLTGQPRR